MPEFELVVAAAKGGIIGRDGGMPWHIPSELKRFKQLTLGKPVIMGRKTWESLPKRPLPVRTNIVITRQRNYQAEGAIIVASKEEAIAAAGDAPTIAVIGGGEIFAMFMDMASRVYLTVVDITVNGDTHFPSLPQREWHDEVVEIVEAGSSPGAPAYEIHKLERKVKG